MIRLAVLRRCRRRRASIGAALLSIFLLGLLDSAALAPLAYLAALVGGTEGWLRVGLLAVAAAGVVAAGVVLCLRTLAGHRLVARFRIARFVGEHATGRREAVHAWLAVAASWALRALAVFVLLAALGLGTDFSLALAFVCASSASAVLPVAPAGAAVQAGAGAAILIASGMRTDDAVAFGVAAQALVIASGAAFVLALGVWHLHGRLPSTARLERRASPA